MLRSKKIRCPLEKISILRFLCHLKAVWETICLNIKLEELSETDITCFATQRFYYTMPVVAIRLQGCHYQTHLQLLIRGQYSRTGCREQKTNSIDWNAADFLKSGNSICQICVACSAMLYAWMYTCTFVYVWVPCWVLASLDRYCKMSMIIWIEEGGGRIHVQKRKVGSGGRLLSVSE